jgi:hypothetical protein
MGKKENHATVSGFPVSKMPEMDDLPAESVMRVSEPQLWCRGAADRQSYSDSRQVNVAML